MAVDPKNQPGRRRGKRSTNRHWGLRLTVAALFLLLCGGLIYFVARGGRSESTPPTTLASQAGDPTALQTEAPPPTEPFTVIHFAVGGDLNITDNVIGAGGPDGDFTQALMDVAYLFADADVAAVNLEGNFNGAPYGSATHSAPETLATALAHAGVDLVQLANSYSIVNGMLGLSSTIDAVRAAGMEPLGVAATNEAFAKEGGYTIRTVQGIKIAFVAFTKGMVGGMALPSGSEKCVNLLYRDYSSTYQDVNTAGITAILDAVQAEKPDITVAMLHWGSEYNDALSNSQNSICKLMQQHGVDIIIGTHAHYVQKMTLDAQTGSFVAYCLGDFWGDAQRAGSEYSVILDLEITRDNATGETRVTNFTYTPIFTVAEEGAPLRVVRIREAMAAYEENYIDKVSEKTYNAMAYALERIEARIHADSADPAETTPTE